MNGNTPDRTEQDDLYEVFAGKTMLQNIRDTVSQACTGYDYEDLKEEVTNPDNDGGLEIDEIEEVDRTVTLLLHLFKYHLAQQPSCQAIEDVTMLPTEEYVEMRYTANPIRAFELFIKENVHPSLHAHFADSDDNSAEFVRRAISQAIERAKIEARIDENELHLKKFHNAAESIESERLYDLLQPIFTERITDLKARLTAPHETGRKI